MSLSERTQNLLSGGEGTDIEYKSNINQDFNEILVSFANAEGGICLFGVQDDQDEKGRHIGKVVGIDISDRTRGQIQSRADQTVDKIPIIIEVETDNDGNGIYIVTIMEGKNKPYCTGGGRYLVRRDGQNTIITPTMMEQFLALRMTKIPSAKKQLLLEELRELKETMKLGLNDIRKNIPPYHESTRIGMIRHNDLDNLVASLTVDDGQLIQACNDFVKMTIIFANEWFKAAEVIAQKGHYGSDRPATIKLFLESGGEKYKNSLEELYKKISARIDAILS